MQKIFCLLIFLAAYTQLYSRTAFNDSMGKDGKKNTPELKLVLLKQSIVRTAVKEFEWWRTDSVLREHHDPGVKKVKQYWLSVGKQMKETQLKDSLFQEQHPWSSAFISWVIVKAGAANKFKPSPNHAGYIVWARQNHESIVSKDIFVAYDVCDPGAKWPEPGDLVCKNRDGNNFTLSSIKSSDISHSDIVVEVDTVAGTITTIGGNLNNTVSKRVIHLDADGYIDSTVKWQIQDEEKGNPEGSQSDFFAVIKLKAAKPKLRPRQNKTDLLAARH